MGRLIDTGFKSILHCDNCGSYNLKVYNSREHRRIRWRARECLMCGTRFTSYEIRKEDFEELVQLRKCKKALITTMGLMTEIINKMEGGN